MPKTNEKNNDDFIQKIISDVAKNQTEIEDLKNDFKKIESRTKSNAELSKNVGELIDCIDSLTTVVDNKQNMLTAGTGILIEGNQISTNGATVQEKLVAGNNITIENNVISSTGGNVTLDIAPTENSQNAVTSGGVYSALLSKQNTLVAGENITIQNGTISANVDTTNLQPKLSAGSGINIVGNTISATNSTYTAGTGIAISDNTISADTSTLATKTDLTQKQDVLTAGDNITINNGVISATNTTYTAGTGILIEGNQISTNGATVQEKLVAGNNIRFDGNIISATGTTYTAGSGIAIDQNNQISADTTTLATKTDLTQKQDVLTAGNNITIQNGVISATNTTYTAGTGIDITNGVISSTTSGGAGGMTAEQENQLRTIWNYYQSLQNDPDPSYNPQTFSDYPVGTIFKTYDVYERNLEFSSTSAEITLPTIYFVAEAGSEANIFVQTKLTSTTANLNLLVSVYVNSTLVSQETTTISAGETKVYEKTIFGVALNQTAKNNNMYIKIERNGSGTIVCTHEKVEIIAPNADIFNKISPYSVEYIGGYYYVADCRDGTAKLATIAVEDMNNMSNLNFVNLGFEAEHLAVAKNTINYNNTYFYDKTLYVANTKNNKLFFKVPEIDATFTWNKGISSYDWEFKRNNHFTFLSIEQPGTAQSFIYYTPGNYIGDGNISSKFSNIITLYSMKKYIANPNEISTIRVFTQINNYGEIFLSYGSRTTDSNNISLGYGTKARLYLKNYTGTDNFTMEIYVKRFDKIIKYDVHIANATTGFIIDNITTIGSYDDFYLGANNDYFVIKNGALEYHKFPTQNE